ncbi:MAG: N-acetylmuramoyl-L-alanine amidase, partial [Woeseiaceae bacterium]
MSARALATLIVSLLFCLAAKAETTLENVRIWTENDKTRVVLDLSAAVSHNIFTLRGPDRLVIDLKDGRLAKTLVQLPAGTGAVKSIRSAIRANGQLRVVLDLAEGVRSRSFTTGPNAKYGDRLVVDLQRSGSLVPVKRASEEYRPGRDIVIAIDAGHGGYDPGAIGKQRTREKDIALVISRQIARRINAEEGMKAVLVRDSDIHIDHRTRTGIARRNRADLFVSVHADAVSDRRANGASVYALSLKGASD